jgi:hypothetical protein
VVSTLKTTPVKNSLVFASAFLIAMTAVASNKVNVAQDYLFDGEEKKTRWEVLMREIKSKASQNTASKPMSVSIIRAVILVEEPVIARGRDIVELVLGNYMDYTQAALETTGLNTEVEIMAMLDWTYGDVDTSKDMINTREQLYADYQAGKFAKYGADLIIGLNVDDETGQPDGACGVSWIGSVDPGDTPFFVVDVTEKGCNSTTLAHELGHTLGSLHTDDTSDRGYMPMARGYACNGLETLMTGNGGRRHQFFSTPTIEINSDVCGDVDTADNKTVFETTIPMLAAKAGEPTQIPMEVSIAADLTNVSEGDEASFRLIRNGDLNTESSIVYLVSAGDDTDLVPTEVVFAPGEDMKTVSFVVTNDSAAEAEEQVTISLSKYQRNNAIAAATENEWTFTIAASEANTDNTETPASSSSGGGTLGYLLLLLFGGLLKEVRTAEV